MTIDPLSQSLLIQTDPDAGSTVSIDRVVLLVVSSGPPTAIVPPVVGLDQASATASLNLVRRPSLLDSTPRMTSLMMIVLNAWF